ncbi:MAG: prevent-host-death protein [Nitriliruptor sp.]|nr:MAG: prevent-host-death protein [Nitriliruptor sp.]
MDRTISQRELRNDSGAIVRALDHGEAFVVTQNGIPIGDLRPVRQHFVTRERLLEAFAGAPPIDPARFHSDVDAYIDQDPEPRA